jgi:hypothetical protein
MFRLGEGDDKSNVDCLKFEPLEKAKLNDLQFAKLPIPINGNGKESNEVQLVEDELKIDFDENNIKITKDEIGIYSEKLALEKEDTPKGGDPPMEKCLPHLENNEESKEDLPNEKFEQVIFLGFQKEVTEPIIELKRGDLIQQLQELAQLGQCTLNKSKVFDIPLQDVNMKLIAQLKKLNENWSQFHENLVSVNNMDTIFLNKLNSEKKDSKVFWVRKEETDKIILKLEAILLKMKDEMEILSKAQCCKKFICSENSHVVFIFRNSKVEAIYFDGEKKQITIIPDENLPKELRLCNSEDLFDAYLRDCLVRVKRLDEQKAHFSLEIHRICKGGGGRLAKLLALSQRIAEILDISSQVFSWWATIMPNSHFHQRMVGMALVALGAGFVIGAMLIPEAVAIGAVFAVGSFLTGILTLFGRQTTLTWAERFEGWGKCLGEAKDLVTGLQDFVKV